MNGVFLIDKDMDCTSRDVVNEIVKKVETSKVGHTGTLDPMATGVLMVCVGKATKLVDILTSKTKEYEAEITLGIDTDTYDITGNVLKRERPNVSDDEIINTLKSFIGEYNQEVPIYSAVKVNGKKLYEYAREGIKVDLPKRLVSIYNLDLISPIKRENNQIIFKIKVLVSKGTYIRSLVHDIALKLGTCGIMSSLRRTKLGNISIDQCKKIDDLRLSDMLSLKEVLADYPCILTDELLKKDILNGKIIENTYGKDYIVFMDNEENILALYHTYEKDHTKLKPLVMLGGIK